MSRKTFTQEQSINKLQEIALHAGIKTESHRHHIHITEIAENAIDVINDGGRKPK